LNKNVALLVICAVAGVPLLLIFGLVFLLTTVLGGSPKPDAAGQGGVPSSVPGIHPTVLAAYGKAAATASKELPKCTGMRWSVLAGIGKVETQHATLPTPGNPRPAVQPNGDVMPPIIGPALRGEGIGWNYTPIPDTDDGRWDTYTDVDAAVGPMQFMPGTWKNSGRDGDGDGTANMNNVYDAALSAAYYLCGSGKSDLNDSAQLNKAIMRYNASSTYVSQVRGFIAEYDKLSVQVGPENLSGDWAYPLPTKAQVQWSAYYGKPGPQWSLGCHTGHDFAVPAGTPIYAVGSGTVYSAQTVNSYGNEVIIKHSKNRYSQYAHMTTIMTTAGKKVRAGEQIGTVGTSGTNSTGPHLHLEMRSGPAFGDDFSPLPWLRAQGAPIPKHPGETGPMAGACVSKTTPP
jgi:hypothetical protein